MIEVGRAQAGVHALRRCGDAGSITRSHIELGLAKVSSSCSWHTDSAIWNIKGT
jgi:hypothetical protein